MCILPQTPAQYNNSDDFTAQVKGVLTGSIPDSFALVSLDFDNFNYVNDLFGYDVGDQTLAAITVHLSGFLREGELFTRPHADHFLLWLRCEQTQSIAQRLRAMLDLRSALAEILPAHYSLVCGGGIAYVSDPDESFSGLMDKANFARKLAKGNHVNTFVYYDKRLNEDLRWRKSITLTMESALQNKEFEMHLQPKVLLKTGSIVGAEALVRWNNAQYGMILPGRFIPIFEQNGFVRQLDFYMLEQACRFLRRCLDEELTLLPVSVNFSKMHIRSSNFVERIFRIVNQYDIPTRLLEIEFTESVFSENFEALSEIVKALKYLGFRVSLDDFGSAYSSLNSLKDLPLDVIKIDKGFLDPSVNNEKARLIIAKMIELIKSLRMVPVMEGVETEEQVQFLQKMSCDLAQGYYYAKPLPIDDYAALLQDGAALKALPHLLAPQPEDSSTYLQVIPQEFQMDSWELYILGKNIDMGLIKGYLDEDSTVQYVNDKALEYLGYTRQEFRERFQNKLSAFTHPSDAAFINENLQKLARTGQPFQFKTRALRKDGKVIVLQGRSSCVLDSAGRPIGLHAFQDVTEDLEHTEALQKSLQNKIAELESSVAALRENREALRLSEERYRLIVEQSDDITFEWDFESDCFALSEKYEKLFGRRAIETDFTQNPAIRGRIHPDDLPQFEEWVEKTYRQPNCTQMELRFETALGAYLWVRVRSTPIFDEDGAPMRAVGVLSNINKEKNELDTFKRKSQLDPLTKLYNKEETHRRIQLQLERQPGRAFAFFIIDVDNFKGVNDTLGHQLGDTLLVEMTQKIQQLFREEDIVGRIGGDEFAVFTCGFARGEALEQKAQQLVNTLRATYFGPLAQYALSCSVGIACCPQHGTTMEQLYHYADVALYDSKRSGKNCYTIYHKSLRSGEQQPENKRTPVEHADRFLTHYFENDYTYSIFEMLYETKDTSLTIHRILEMTGKRFRMDRVYIFQNEEDGNATSNTFEWCASDITPQKELLQNIPLCDLAPYLNAYDDEGILCCANIATLDPFARALLEEQNVTSVLHCALYSAGEMVGFIGFDICGRVHEWEGAEIATLGYLSRILSVFLLKNRISQDLLSSYESYREMLGNLNGYVYVVDADSYELLYLNRPTAKLGLKLGSACYYEAFHLDAPCENCPLKKMTPEQPYASSEIYSQQLDTWVNSAASRLHWNGHENAALICCTDISMYKKP